MRHLVSLIVTCGLAAALPSSVVPQSISAGTSAIPTGCPLDNCLWADQIPAESATSASQFCESYLQSIPGTKTVTVVQSAFETVTNTDIASTVTTQATILQTITSGSVCSTTVTGEATSWATIADYPTLAAPPPAKAKRDLDTPAWFTSGCKSKCKNTRPKISSACSCFLASPTATVTQITSIAATADVTPSAQTVTETVTANITVNGCTSTATSTINNYAGVLSCGISFASAPAASASGTKTCTNSVPLPSQNVLFRIEGNDSEGTIFEGCQVSGPQVVTTPSGGSHECDGTNNGANRAPGTTPTDLIKAAAAANGFVFDGTWDNTFDDFFITSISSSTQTNTQFWGVLNNGQFTPSGGCQFETFNGDRSLWAFDAFNKNVFLKVVPDYAVVEAGSGTITVTITDDQTGSTAAGASFAGQTSDAGGQVTFAVPSQPGCYQYKATRSDALRSNAFYLGVFNSF